MCCECALKERVLRLGRFKLFHLYNTKLCQCYLCCNVCDACLILGSVLSTNVRRV